MKNSVIIVAGGKGLRMGGELPKQFVPIGGKPMLMHTIESFYRYDSQIQIVLVLPESHREYWQELCMEYRFEIGHLIAMGGETRFHSVKNGLALVIGQFVGVHDAARPFVDSELIDRCYNEANLRGTAIPVTDATDSLRETLADDKSRIIDRTKIKLVQTPQVFSTKVLTEAYRAQYTDLFTDDASVVESMGTDVHLVAGNPRNIKVTTPIDLLIAEILLTSPK